ncbi:hypothetical protein BKA82DRAFT_4219759 [Pisolithus tinctorius]|nr:hypothetical protein BKA82DRAFT_4219759 [Pisolithus tinctorius]
MASAKDIVENAIANRRVRHFRQELLPVLPRIQTTLKELFPPDDVLIFECEGGQAIQDYIAVKTGKKTVPQTFISVS